MNNQPDNDKQPQPEHIPTPEEIDAAYEQFGEQAADELASEVVFRASVHDFMAKMAKKHKEDKQGKKDKQEQDHDTDPDPTPDKLGGDG